MTEQQPVAQVISPRFNIGRWCAFFAVVMWFLINPAGDFLARFEGGNVATMLYIVLMIGFAIRAGHDLFMWVAQASKALKEKRQFEAMGVSAAVQWAHQKAIHDALTLPVEKLNADPKLVAEYERLMLEKYPTK